MPVLGVVAVDVHKTLVKPHAAQLGQFAVDVFGQQDVIDRHRREPVAAVKVESHPVHVLAVGRAADGSIVLATSASAVLFAVHRHAENLPDMLDQLFKLLCGVTQTTAAVALQLAPLKVRSDRLVEVDHLTGSTGSRRALPAFARRRSARRARPLVRNTSRRARSLRRLWRGAEKHQVA